jgi:signal transduction protein with GAF and PtsI domain
MNFCARWTSFPSPERSAAVLFAADRGTPSLSNRYDHCRSPCCACWTAWWCSFAAKVASVRYRCAAGGVAPLEAMALVGLADDTVVPASGIMPVKALLADLDLAAFPVC